MATTTRQHGNLKCGNENQKSENLMAPGFEVFGYHNQNYLLIFMSPDF